MAVRSWLTSWCRSVLYFEPSGSFMKIKKKNKSGNKNKLQRNVQNYLHPFNAYLGINVFWCLFYSSLLQEMSMEVFGWFAQEKLYSVTWKTTLLNWESFETNSHQYSLNTNWCLVLKIWNVRASRFDLPQFVVPSLSGPPCLLPHFAY